MIKSNKIIVLNVDFVKGARPIHGGIDRSQIEQIQEARKTGYIMRW